MAEEMLAKVRKISANKECVNCGEKSRLGFGAVCVKFGTFVCNNCKSSHQAYSHRVKSVTMSTWTKEEVEALKRKNGGGNEVAKAKWYAKWTPADDRYLPKPGDNLDKYKQLILMVYEEKRWYDANANPGPEESEKPTPRRKEAHSKQSAKLVAASKPSDSGPSLLSFDDPDPFTTPSSNGTESMGDMFGSLTIKSHSSAPSNATKSSQQPLSKGEVDLFGSDGDSGNLLDSFNFTNSPPVNGMNGSAPTMTNPSGGMKMGGMAPVPTSSAAHMTATMDDPFSELHQPKMRQVRMTPAQIQQMQMQQMQQMQRMQQMQQQQQQQQAMFNQPAFATNSDDPFAVLHMPKMPPVRPPMQARPSAMPQMGGGMPNQPMMGMPRGPTMPMQSQQQPMMGMPKGMPMAQQQPPRGFFPMGGMATNSDDPFAGLQ